MAQTSIHFQPVKGGSEEHNKRTKKLDYVHHELSSQNDYWQSCTQESRLAFVKDNAKAKTGRKMQAKATPIREAVVVIKDATTMDDLKELSKRLHDRFGIEVFQIAIHKDEGYTKGKDGIKLNLHAHLVADWTDHETGKSLKLNRNDMSEMQTLVAEVLDMERGVSSDKKHLTAMQYKEQKAREEAEEAIKAKERAEQKITKALEREKSISAKSLATLLSLNNKQAELTRTAREVKKMRSEATDIEKSNKSLSETQKALRSEISGLQEQKSTVLGIIAQKEQLEKDIANLKGEKFDLEQQYDSIFNDVARQERILSIQRKEVQELTQERDKAEREMAAARKSLQSLTANKDKVQNWKWGLSELVKLVQPILDAIKRLAHSNERVIRFLPEEVAKIDFALGRDNKREERAARYTRWAREQEESPKLYGDYRYQCAGEEMMKIARDATAYTSSLQQGQSRGRGY